MILCKLNILQDAINLLVIVVQNANPQKDDPGKVRVPFDLPQVRPVQKDLVLASRCITSSADPISVQQSRSA